ncbi:MAG: glycosyltransferase family 39 protein, partial [Elusimicrobiota bacterium]
MKFKRAFVAGLKRHRAFLTVVPPAALLRLVGIGYGLPAVFNGDEPHHVNVAMSFGRGSLNPGIFKYPTLWMYVLFAAYAGGFILWSGAGLLGSAQEFGELFVWRHSGFYLAGRLLSTAFSLGGLWWVYRAAGLAGGRPSGVLAAALLAVSAPMIESAHSVKPDCLMFFFAAWSWWQAMAYLELGGCRRLLLCAAAVGLSVSSQYTAAPLAVLVPVVWLARRRLRPGRADGAGVLAAALAVVGLLFLAGTPFALLDAPTFARDVRDSWAAHGAGQAMTAGWRPLFNLMGFSASWPLGAVVLSAGIVRLGRRSPAHALCLLLPCAATVLFFSRQAVGGNARYLYSVFPAVAILSALGVRTLVGRGGVF